MSADPEYRYRNALLWIRTVAGMHYFGQAFDPEHMRGIANIAANALAGRDLKDFDTAMADAKVHALELAEKLGIELADEGDHDD